MDKKVKLLLEGKGENHIAPFFWQHGETEEVLREYMEVIQNAGCGAVCVESRPHPDFCGEKWWTDMDVILDEARKRSMKVWILDDSHFPTGYANGALENAPAELCRQSVFSNEVEFEVRDGVAYVDVNAYVHPPKLKLSMLAELASKMSPEPRHFGEDVLLSVTAISADTKEIQDLSGLVKDGKVEWHMPEGNWNIYVNGLSRDCGPHRSYINMMDETSCKVLIDTVYEAHYAHYKEDFGKTIAGFFSDEPELGNGILYMQNNPIGTEQDLPWSKEVEEELNRCAGDTWKAKLPLLWNTNADETEAAQIRYLYMDIVTRLVQKDFSEQVGTWCREHGVEYIGHVIEDEGQHCRTASSLGHYFRGLYGQDMAGIDDIGGQVFPGGEDGPDEGPMGRTRNGEFYHYGLAALAASAAAIETRKKGRAMCEIFGNYGWKEGVKLETYLADHFLARGINFFVPHAFSPKAFPDTDCPPHFYAHGNNPQYRHFGKLIRYMNRVAELFSDGKRIVSAAVLYHGESEWAGESMPFEKVMRELADHQICADVIPADVFDMQEEYRTVIGKTLKINTQEYQVLLVPEAKFVPAGVIKAVKEMQKAGFPVLFINGLPKCCNGEDALVESECEIVALKQLAEEMKQRKFFEMEIAPANNRVRVFHYRGEHDMFMIINEGDTPYCGRVTLPAEGSCYRYNAMENQLERVEVTAEVGKTSMELTVVQGKSHIYIFDEAPEELLHTPIAPEGEKVTPSQWVRSQCRGIEYPAFVQETTVTLPEQLAEEQPEFSGFVRYDTNVNLPEAQKAVLEITEAYEGVEVFVNGESAGLRLNTPMFYDITDMVHAGENQIRIEVATTLERERAAAATDMFEKAMMEEPKYGSGITGTVAVYVR